MEEEYDLTAMRSRPNPYAKRLKKQVTLRVSESVIDFSEGIAGETGIPYELLIDLYLRDCVTSHRKLNMRWGKPHPTQI